MAILITVDNIIHFLLMIATGRVLTSDYAPWSSSKV